MTLSTGHVSSRLLLTALLICTVATWCQMKSCQQDTPVVPIDDKLSQPEQPITLPQDDARATTTIYFTKSRGTQTVTEGVVRQIPKTYANSDVQYIIEALLEGPNHDESILGFFSEIPKGTRLVGVTETEKTIRINLSEQFVSGGGSNSKQQRIAELKRTINSFNTDKHVYVDINGEELEILSGEGVEVAEPVNQEALD